MVEKSKKRRNDSSDRIEDQRAGVKLTEGRGRGCPAGTPNKRTTAKIIKHEPYEDQLALLHKIFSDDENEAEKFFVCHVGWCDEADPPDVICYVLDYKGEDLTTMIKNAKAVSLEELFDSHQFFDHYYVADRVKCYDEELAKTSAAAAEVAVIKRSRKK